MAPAEEMAFITTKATTAHEGIHAALVRFQQPVGFRLQFFAKS